MYNTTFVSTHWFQRERAPALAHALGHAPRQPLQRFLAALPVVADIDNHLRPFLYLAADQQIDHKLERAQCFAAPADQQSHRLLVGTLDMQRDRVLWFALLPRHG